MRVTVLVQWLLNTKMTSRGLLGSYALRETFPKLRLTVGLGEQGSLAQPLRFLAEQVANSNVF